MLQQMLAFFPYFFSNPSVLGIILAVMFGAIWLACYRPPLITSPWLWAVFFASAILTPVAICFTSFPLRAGISWVFSTLLGTEDGLVRWAPLLSIPSMYLFALVRQGFKLVPVVIYWWHKDRNVEPRLGLAAGAVSGTGFGILESQWTLNYIFASGWSWDAVQIKGLVALAPFWESFFVLGTQVASCALASWGLAKGWGWQFYLLSAFVYFFPTYSHVLVRHKFITGVQAEFLIAAWSLIATGVAIWLHERKSKV